MSRLRALLCDRGGRILMTKDIDELKATLVLPIPNIGAALKSIMERNTTGSRAVEYRSFMLMVAWPEQGDALYCESGKEG